MAYSVSISASTASASMVSSFGELSGRNEENEERE
jgi:hypothetical protein